MLAMSVGHGIFVSEAAALSMSALAPNLTAWRIASRIQQGTLLRTVFKLAIEARSPLTNVP
jgi:hypothetical protein